MRGVGVCLVLWMATAAYAQSAAPAVLATGSQIPAITPVEVSPAIATMQPNQPMLSLLRRSIMQQQNAAGRYNNLYNQQMYNGGMQQGGYKNNQGFMGGMGMLPFVMAGAGDSFRQAAMFSMMANQGQGGGNSMLPWWLMSNSMDSPLAMMALMGGGMGGGGRQGGRQGMSNPLMMFSMHEMMN